MSSAALAEMLCWGSNPVSKRESSSAKYARMENCASLAGGVLDLELHHSRREQSLHRRHRFDQSRALISGEWFEERPREVVAQPTEKFEFGPARLRQVGDSHPPVGGIRHHLHEAIVFERPQQPADVAGIQVEACAQRANVAPVGADLPQQSRRADRPAAGQVLIVQDPDSLRDRRG